MSISIGIYDLFAYTIPGLLYMYVAYEILALTGVVEIDIVNQLSSAGFLAVILVAIAAFLTGQIFDNLAHWFVFSLIYRDKTSQLMLDKIKQRDSGANIQFEAKDWHLLLVLLRQRNLEVAQTFDKHEADSIMFRNISLIALLNALVLGAKAIIENPTWWNGAVISFVVCIVTARRSRTLHTWFFEGIFLAALEYGRSVEEVLVYRVSENNKPRQVANKGKEKRK